MFHSLLYKGAGALTVALTATSVAHAAPAHHKRSLAKLERQVARLERTVKALEHKPSPAPAAQTTTVVQPTQPGPAGSPGKDGASIVGPAGPAGASATTAQVQAAVSAYLKANPPAAGVAGAPGQPGAGATDSQVQAAVDQYCGADSRCVGATGEQGAVGPQGVAGSLDAGSLVSWLGGPQPTESQGGSVWSELNGLGAMESAFGSQPAYATASQLSAAQAQEQGDFNVLSNRIAALPAAKVPTYYYGQTAVVQTVSCPGSTTVVSASAAGGNALISGAGAPTGQWTGAAPTSVVVFPSGGTSATFTVECE